MLIQNLFDRDINRDINGVVKADELDDATIWQELDEFVVTKELDKVFRDFFAAFLDSDGGSSGKGGTGGPGSAGESSKKNIGVWVSGFFGSGKSHLIKILSYMLRNQSVTQKSETKRAVDFLAKKIADPMLLGDIKRAVSTHSDVVLFNIDAKATQKPGRDAILQVFLKVFNQLQGYSGDHAHIAFMERYLSGKGKLDAFHTAFTKATGSDWLKERDAYTLTRDEVVTAFMEASGQSKQSAEKWIDNAEEDFSLSVENFAKWVKEYLDTKGPNHRIVFVADEVGQFIGNDSHLMLSLQTIAEELGVVCKGRAWVIVTSQEDIDSVLGEMKKSKDMDFSKIQGRFKTRLSLTSANVDEVIQARLLAKEPTVVPELELLFGSKGDIIKNQLTFTDAGMTLKPFAGSDDFVKNYPFAPYQFLLLQKIFESIRKAGATGLHLARGERSLLDAFQTAAKLLGNEEVGVLVPLYCFYPSIESFLDTAVKKTIDQAKERNLEDFDVELLKVLFLIRYVEEIKGNLDTLVTLCIDRIDADRLALRKKIEASLGRLDKETLINRSGQIYSFLTNEERDVSREIKSVELTGGEDAKLLGEIIFDDVLKGQKKHRYSVNRMDFPLTRFCDQYAVGSKVEGSLVVSIISPLNDDYSFYSDEKCKLESGVEDGQLIVRLGNDDALARELIAYKRTDKYLANKNDGTLNESTKRILRSFAEDNRERRNRLVVLASDALVSAGFFAAGQGLGNKATGPSTAMDAALEYLVKNTFTKMGLLKHLHAEPNKETQAVLKSNDVGQLQLALKAEDGNAQALAEVRNYIELATKASKQIVLYEMVEGRFASRPYGWLPAETVLFVAQLVAVGEISLVTDGATIPVEKAYEPLTTPAKQRKVTIVQRKTTDPKAVQDARKLGKDLFAEMGPDGEDALFTFLKSKLAGWQSSLKGYRVLADSGGYPGGTEITSGLTLIKPLLGDDESFKFIERFNGLKADLSGLSGDFHNLENFYEHQKPTWDKLRKACERFQPNRLQLDSDPKASAALKRMHEILAAPAPYALLKEVDNLIQTVDAINKMLIDARRGQTAAKVQKQITAINNELDDAKADDTLRASCRMPIEKLAVQVSQSESLAFMAQAEQEAVRLFDIAMARIQQWSEKQQQPHPAQGGGIPSKPVVVVKPLQVITPSELVTQTFLETTDDVEAFIEKLRKALTTAVAEKKRIQIR